MCRFSEVFTFIIQVNLMPVTPFRRPLLFPAKRNKVALYSYFTFFLGDVLQNGGAVELPPATEF